MTSSAANDTALVYVGRPAPEDCLCVRCEARRRRRDDETPVGGSDAAAGIPPNTARRGAASGWRPRETNPMVLRTYGGRRPA